MEESEICETTGGFTQKDVANVLHVTNTYSKYEIGVSRYPLDAIIKLAEYYGVSIDYLVGLTDEPKPYPRKKNESFFESIINLFFLPNAHSAAKSWTPWASAPSARRTCRGSRRKRWPSRRRT